MMRILGHEFTLFIACLVRLHTRMAKPLDSYSFELPKRVRFYKAYIVLYSPRLFMNCVKASWCRNTVGGSLPITLIEIISRDRHISRAQ